MDSQEKSDTFMGTSDNKEATKSSNSESIKPIIEEASVEGEAKANSEKKKIKCLYTGVTMKELGTLLAVDVLIQNSTDQSSSGNVYKRKRSRNRTKFSSKNKIFSDEDGKEITEHGNIRKRRRTKKTEPDSITKMKCDVKRRVVKTYDVEGLSIGTFKMCCFKGSNNQCTVCFFSLSRSMTYDLHINCCSMSYTIGYSISFDHITTVNFQNRLIQIKLCQPAKETYYRCEEIESDSICVEKREQFNVTREQNQTAILHTIFLKRNQTRTWIRTLLKVDKEHFESILMNNGNLFRIDDLNDFLKNNRLPKNEFLTESQDPGSINMTKFINEPGKDEKEVYAAKLFEVLATSSPICSLDGDSIFMD